MKKLTRTYTASIYDRTTLTVNGEIFDVANLLKSGITNQSVILVGQDDKWNQIETQQYGINANATDFVNAVNSGVIPLTELGFSEQPRKRKTADSSIKHEDYERLHRQFPEYPCCEISKLHRYITANGRKSHYSDLRDFLAQIAKRNESVDQYIKRSDSKIKITMLYEINDCGVCINPEMVYGFNKNIVTIKIYVAFNGEKWAFGTDIRCGSQGSSFPCSQFIRESKQDAANGGAHAALLSLRQLIIERPENNTLQECFKEIQNLIKNNMSTKTTSTAYLEREAQLKQMGFTHNPAGDTYEGNGFTITGNSLENDSDEDWQNMVERIDQYSVNVPGPDQPTDPRVQILIDLGFTIEGDRIVKVTNGQPYGISIQGLTKLNYQEFEDYAKTFGFAGYKTLTPAADTPPPPAEFLPAVPTEAPGRLKSMGLSVIENIQPDKITEFKNLEKETLQLIKSNPLVKITDKTTLDKAKVHRAAMLKACTAIDGKEGVSSITTKAFNTVKKTLTDYLGGISAKRRAHYAALNSAVEDFENAEALKAAEEQRLRLLKIKERTDLLYAVPMNYNGTMFNIGTLYIMPSQINDLTDEEFAVELDKARAIKIELDKVAEAQKSQAELIAELQAKLAALTGETVAVTESPAAAPVTESPASPVSGTVPATTQPQQLSAPVAPALTATVAYTRPLPENYLLAKLDGENVRALQNGVWAPAYITARNFYKRGGKELAEIVMDILKDDDPTKPNRATRIGEFCKIIANQE